MFGQKRKETKTYDPALLTPAIRSSICTGEKAAGFTEKATGRFREVMLIRDERDLAEFRRRYGIEEEIETIY
ncbi:MAG: aspartate dehydrogenase [Lachnospiraceae bacterium]|nr:aspartate dehydrogenase [Lachnospiraceae bacterium]